VTAPMLSVGEVDAVHDALVALVRDGSRVAAHEEMAMRMARALAVLSERRWKLDPMSDGVWVVRVDRPNGRFTRYLAEGHTPVEAIEAAEAAGGGE
jgi:hypothetical protein